MPYIELVGPPGSGKTTYALQVIANNPKIFPGRLSIANTKEVGYKLGALKKRYLFALPYLLVLFPVDFFYTINFFLSLTCPLRIRIYRTKDFLLLLLRSRVLRKSKIIWLIDQGLLQHVITSFAFGYLSKRSAINWVSFCGKSAIYSPKVIEKIFVGYDVLLSRIQNSSKHKNQTQNMSIETYIDKHVNSFFELMSTLEIEKVNKSKFDKKI